LFGKFWEWAAGMASAAAIPIDASRNFIFGLLRLGSCASRHNGKMAVRHGIYTTAHGGRLPSPGEASKLPGE
jgi:hypothetical protein